jgi:microcystin-dependent protein
MSDQYVGEIQAFPFAFAVGGFNNAWLPCGGQLLPLQRYTALFSLIGTYYGGNGTSNFALPNLNGAIAISQGQGPGLENYVVGQTVGSSTVSLTSDQMAMHSHALQLGVKNAQGATAGPGPAGTTVAIDPNFTGFVPPPGNLTLAANAVTLTGQDQSHDNTQPTQALVWCIAFAGLFPSFDSS